MKTELLVGCGSLRDKRLFVENKTWSNLKTLDINPERKPDIIWDLLEMPYPFEDNSFDEIHAYEILEHLGFQGDYKFFFAQFSEFWRILKPDGFFMAITPSRFSKWALGDPSHTRILQKENLMYLDQEQYYLQVNSTPMSDFRYLYKADFRVAWQKEDNKQFAFILQAVKPARTWS